MKYWSLKNPELHSEPIFPLDYIVSENLIKIPLRYKFKLIFLKIIEIKFYQINLNERVPSYLGLTSSISWLLMPWLFTSPGHQHP